MGANRIVRSYYCRAFATGLHLKESMKCTRILMAAGKTLAFSLAVMCLCWIALAWTGKKMADDIWKQLGLTQSEADINIKYSILNGNFAYFGAKNARNIVAGDRIAVIRDLATYAKKYAASAEFKREYEANRARRKPADAYLRTFSVDSFKLVEKERIAEAIKATEANANHSNPKIKNAVPYRLEALKKELTDLDDPNNRRIKTYVDNYQRSNDAALKKYGEALKKYESEWPADPKLMIRRRLQQMLDITADVDYSAELKDGRKYREFVNPVYEAKPKEWKLAFRAGKPATDAVRTIAQQWLQELN